jgi:hypothetical protein
MRSADETHLSPPLLISKSRLLKILVFSATLCASSATAVSDEVELEAEFSLGLEAGGLMSWTWQRAS